jgi:hypothetical protein
MSAQNKFFDERTATETLSRDEVTTQLKHLVDLEMEVYVNSLENGVGGTFRVVWMNTRAHNGSHRVGLALLESDADLWEIEFPPSLSAEVWLECQRCKRQLQATVPEAEPEFVCEGFRVSRHCEQCKVTTSWKFVSEVKQTPQVPGQETKAQVPPTLEKKAWVEQRMKGRAPLRMAIKVIRRKYGEAIEDTSETKNVSRGGAYFLSKQNYDVGELVEVIIPYKEGDLNIPVAARVVRVDQSEGSFHKGVAVHLEKEAK